MSALHLWELNQDYGVGCPAVTRQGSQVAGQYVPCHQVTECYSVTQGGETGRVNLERTSCARSWRPLGFSEGGKRGLPSPLEALECHRKRQIEKQLRAGAKWQDNDLVFSFSKGTPMDAQNIANRYFKPLLRRAGLPEIRWHDLRHTCATLLLSRGTHPTYVQKLLGHASVPLTIDRYSHWMPSMGKHTANAMDEALG